MNKKSTTPFFLTTFLILFFMSNSARGQELPRWEDFDLEYTGLIENSGTDIVRSSGEVRLLSNNTFIHLNNQPKHFTRLSSVDDLKADFIEIDSKDSVWLVSSSIIALGDNANLAFARYFNDNYKSFYRSDFVGFSHQNDINNV